MPNGQLRFAIYDRNGQLEPATPAILGDAGKPGKCMWCHESALQILRTSTHRVPGHISPEAFTNEMKSANLRLRNYQNGLNTEVHFYDKFEHVHQEKIYIAFMEPSARRLSWEWGLPLKKVEELVKYLQPHTHHEFPEMGQLYDREQIWHLAPFRTAKTPASVREPSPDEPNFCCFILGNSNAVQPNKL
ncbi:MAG: hypothetical protein IPJ82_19585 [Lewinellaceae bacterium]|nr:hypothetical protein [Lewinellaceae bacterium]